MQTATFIRYRDRPLIHIDTFSDCGMMLIDTEEVCVAEIRMRESVHVHLRDHSKPMVEIP